MHCSQSLGPSDQEFTLAGPGTCEFDKFVAIEQLITNGLAEFESNHPNSPLLGIVRTYAQGALLASPEWSDCQAYIDSFLTTTTKTVDNKVLCAEVPGTAEFNADPCCYVNLQLYQCCVPRTVTVNTTSPNSLAIQSKCETPQCSEQVINTWSAITNRRTGFQCTQETILVFINLVFTARLI